MVFLIPDVNIAVGVHGYAAGLIKPRRAAGAIRRARAAGRAGQRAKSVLDRDRERVAGGRRRVDVADRSLGSSDRSGTDSKAGHDTGRGIDRGFAGIAARVADRAVAAPGEGRGDGVGLRGAHCDRGGAWRGEGTSRARVREGSFCG